MRRGQNTELAAPTRGHREDGGGADSRPHCLRCRRPMHSSGPRRWLCKGCGASSVRYSTRRPTTPDPLTRPCCVSCRRAMKSDGAAKFRCRPCGLTLESRPKRPARRPDILRRPLCPKCGREMSARRRGRYFTCCPCYNRRRRLRRDSDTADALLREIAGSLPGYLTPDERDDAAQSVMLDILAARLAPCVPAPRTLRRYATAARGMSSDRFKFISLSQPTRDGREFGEGLAA
jgi:hypothetical protein